MSKVKYKLSVHTGFSGAVHEKTIELESEDFESDEEMDEAANDMAEDLMYETIEAIATRI